MNLLYTHFIFYIHRSISQCGRKIIMLVTFVYLLLILISFIPLSLNLSPNAQENIDRLFIDFYAFLPQESYLYPDCRLRMHNILQLMVRRFEPGIYRGQVRIAVTDGHDLNIDFDSEVAPGDIIYSIGENGAKDGSYFEYYISPTGFHHFTRESSRRRTIELSYWLTLFLSCSENFMPSEPWRRMLFRQSNKSLFMAGFLVETFVVVEMGHGGQVETIHQEQLSDDDFKVADAILNAIFRFSKRHHYPFSTDRSCHYVYDLDPQCRKSDQSTNPGCTYKNHVKVNTDNGDASSKVCPLILTPCGKDCDLIDSSTTFVEHMSTETAANLENATDESQTSQSFEFPREPERNFTSKSCKKRPLYDRTTIYLLIGTFTVWIVNIFIYCRFVRRRSQGSVQPIPEPFPAAHRQRNPAKFRRRHKKVVEELVEKVVRRKKQ